MKQTNFQTHHDIVYRDNLVVVYRNALGKKLARKQMVNYHEINMPPRLHDTYVRRGFDGFVWLLMRDYKLTRKKAQSITRKWSGGQRYDC